MDASENNEQPKIDNKSIIPEQYPNTVEECLEIYTKIRYESFGFPYFFLDYDYSNQVWAVAFRNPQNFDNPNIKEKTPLVACHKMFDFLKSMRVKMTTQEKHNFVEFMSKLFVDKSNQKIWQVIKWQNKKKTLSFSHVNFKLLCIEFLKNDGLIVSNLTREQKQIHDDFLKANLKE